MTNRATGIYFASKMEYADVGRQLRTNWEPDYLFIKSGWLDQAHHEHTASPEQFAIHWLRDAVDIRACDGVLLYLPSIHDVPRGALVECGMALGRGKWVLPVGVDHPALGTWQHHPLVLARVRTLEEAFDRLKFLAI